MREIHKFIMFSIFTIPQNMEKYKSGIVDKGMI